MVEVHHQPHSHVGIRLVEAVQHREEGVIEALREERHLLGAHANGFDAGLGQRREPRGELRVREHHRIAAREQDLAQLLPSGLRMTSRAPCDGFVVRADVADDVGDLGHPLLGDRAVLTLDLLARDQLLAVAEAAVRGARRNDVHQTHLVLVQESFHRAVVHLEARILGTLQVARLVRARLHQALDRQALLRQLEVMPGDLDRHAGLHVAIGSLQRAQGSELVLGVEAEHVLGGSLFQKRRQPIDAVALVARAFDGVEKRLLPLGGNVPAIAAHARSPISGRRYPPRTCNAMYIESRRV